MDFRQVEEAYIAFKDLGDLFEIPKTSETVVVGTFDQSHRTFSGLKSDRQYESTADVGDRNSQTYVGTGKGMKKIIRKTVRNRVIIETIPAPYIDAVQVMLEFKIVHPFVSYFYITINGKRHNADQNSQSIQVDAAGMKDISWSISCDGKTYSDKLSIVRPPVVGIGVFTVPAYPVLLLYEPPLPGVFGGGSPNGETYAEYSSSTTYGTTVSTAITVESSETTHPKPEYTSEVKSFRDVGTLENITKGLYYTCKALALINPVFGKIAIYLKKAEKALNKIKNAAGKIKVSDIEGTIQTYEDTLSIAYTKRRKYSTRPFSGGPGDGDQIYYMKNAKFVWMVDNAGNCHLTLLGYECFDAGIEVGQLKKYLNHPEITGLEPDIGASLLEIDTFVAGGAATELPEERFEFIDPIDVRMLSGEQAYELSHEVTETKSKSIKAYNTRITDYRKGFLRFLGIGITQNREARISCAYTEKYIESQSLKKTATLFYSIGEGEYYVINIYYDKVFGTFAFQLSENAPRSRTQKGKNRIAPLYVGVEDSYWSLCSYNYPSRYIAAENFTGVLASAETSREKNEACFKFEKTEDGYFRLGSLSHSGYYLRHKNFKLALEPYQHDRLFTDDSSFRVTPGLTGKETISFEAKNYPGYFIRHQNFQLYLHKEQNSLLYKKDASFKIIGPLRKIIRPK